jgi:hypothetical protein
VACRTAIDVILNECLTVIVSWLDILFVILLMKPRKPQKGYPAETHSTEDSRPRRPKRWDDIKIYCEVSFSHKISSPPGVIVNSRVDHSIGIVVPRMLLQSRTVGFTHSCSSLRPNSNPALTVLYPNSSFTWDVYINLGCDNYEAMLLSTSLLQMVSFSSS